jgi:hypothetical protein
LWVVGFGIGWGGWDTLFNVDKTVNGDIGLFQYSALLGIGSICVGIAAFILGGTIAILNVLVKTRSK